METCQPCPRLHMYIEMSVRLDCVAHCMAPNSDNLIQNDQNIINCQCKGNVNVYGLGAC